METINKDKDMFEWLEIMPLQVNPKNSVISQTVVVYDITSEIPLQDLLSYLGCEQL